MMSRIAACLLGLAAMLIAPVGFAAIAPSLLDDAARAPVSVLVELERRADLSGAVQRKDKTAKTAYVVGELQKVARLSQAPLIELLSDLGIEYRAFWIANAIHLSADAVALRAIAELPGVAAIHRAPGPEFSRLPIAPPEPDQAVRRKDAMIEPGVALIRAPQVWDMGFRGQGVVVGDHDIGVEWDHPALKNQYRGFDGENVDHAYNWRNAFVALDPFCTDPEVACDSHGHGTHTTGTILGDDGEGRQIGVAPAAQWTACRSLYDPVVGLGTVPTYMDCMEWFLAPYPEGQPDAADPAMAPDVINNSWGCLEACPPSILQDIDEATYAAGIVQVGSAGNDGDQCSTIIAPLAIYESTFTIGASTFEDTMASFSSRGPVLSDLSMRLKPNVVAPGSGVVSSDLDGTYSAKSGTSMASPHVSGLVALMISANPELRGQVGKIRELIQQTAVPIQSDEVCGDTNAATDVPNNTFGHGRIDALAAVQAALALASAEAPARAAARSAGGASGLGMLMLLCAVGLRRIMVSGVSARRG